MDTLTNQEFLYRETPVAYDGTGTLTSIKGNTISFNQLIKNGNFADTSNWATENTATLSVSGNVATISHTSSYANIHQNVNVVSGHKYYLTATLKRTNNSNDNIILQISSNGVRNSVSIPQNENNFYKVGMFYTASTNDSALIYVQSNTNNSNNFYAKNVMCFDLTLMGIDTYTVSQVEEYLSTHLGNIPYFDSGCRLISFNGTGLKTTGRNYLTTPYSITNRNGVSYVINDDGSVDLSGSITSLNYYCYFKTVGNTLNLPKGEYTISFRKNGQVFSDLSARVRNELTYDTYIATNGNVHLTLTEDTPIIVFLIGETIGLDCTGRYTVMVQKGNIETPTFEPYTSNTLSLPISTYFPTGMKSTGSAYDELSDKAYTKIGSVDLGTLNYTKYNVAQGTLFRSEYMSTLKPVASSSDIPNVLCSRYVTKANSERENMTISQIGTSKNVDIIDNSYSDATAFKTAMSGVMLYFELETPTETDISLDLTYPIWNGGTEQILPINGSTPTTTPIIADIDYRTMIPVNATDNPDGSGTITGTGNYRYHSMATLTATPTDEIYRFLRWEDENGDTVSTNSTYTFEVGD